jgi:hypothetical protein
LIKVQTTLVAGPRNHRQLTPRRFGFGELSSFVLAAKSQDFDQIAIKEGIEPLACAPRPQFYSVD